MASFPINLVIPMSGQGVRFQAAGFRQPKPLIPINGIPMIERVLASFPKNWKAWFVLAENHRSTELESTLRKLRPNGDITFIPQHKKGPGFAITGILDKLPSGEGIFVSYCDYGKLWNAAEFERFVAQTQCDACITSYKGFHPHYLRPTMYAYSRLDKNDHVVEVREKGCFTENRENEFASAGGYYFRCPEILAQSLEWQKQGELSLGGEWYTSLTVQALLKNKPDADVRIFPIDKFFQWGTPEDLKDFEAWENHFLKGSPLPFEENRVQQYWMEVFGSRK